MSSEALVYPFIFLALYFESFLLVTFLSKPARDSRIAAKSTSTPRVAIIVPCWNEESTVAGTVESLLALEYPKEKLSIILVDDGSIDSTPAVIDSYSTNPQITAIHKINGGKFSAMNAGIEIAKNAGIVGFLDADSYVAPDSLREIVNVFADKSIVAVTASMSIHKPHTILQRMQYAEYFLAITLRHVFASVNGLYVTPGPFSFYRRSLFTDIGLFKHAHLAEDMEMAMRIQRAGLRIGNAIRARVYTKGPATFERLLKQRIRWTTGFLRNLLFDYRDLLGVKKNKMLGLFVLPLGVVAIFGSIFIFTVGIIDFVTSSIHTYSVVQTVPISYTLSWHQFKWFYLPVSTSLFLSIALTASVLAWVVVGKSISNTSGRLVPNIFVYMILYGIITPIWFIYSVSDVVRGARTTWR